MHPLTFLDVYVAFLRRCVTALPPRRCVAPAGQKLRPVGSALSPNGLGFADGDKTDMVSLALLDEVVEVDRVSGRARVQVLTMWEGERFQQASLLRKCEAQS